ncbi:hypothetical protein [Paraburkholderia sp. J8-2]|uniref:hypothetical protein n=1 Tax=Paraburkholderia sp. J8-2 TaxID=2805440 RepID=UPI002AB7750D|nr:hypothetical protein [Paraburkholderia sp. J8-2]
MGAELVKMALSLAAVAGVLVLVYRSLYHKRTPAATPRMRFHQLLRPFVLVCLIVAVCGFLAWWLIATSSGNLSQAAKNALESGTVAVTRGSNSLAIGRQPGGDTPADTGFDVASPSKKN